MLTKRTQVLFDPKQYKILVQEAKKRRLSVGELIRQAVQKVYFKEKPTAKEELIKSISALNAPTSEWEKMEKEIIKGRISE